MKKFRQQLIRTIIYLSLSAVLIVVCYFYVDKPVAFFVYQHQLNKISLLYYFTLLPELFFALAGVMLIYLSAVLAWRTWHKWQTCVFLMSISLMVTVFFKDQLKFVFGRYWPLTWLDNNPSLIHTNSYGFNWFEKDLAFHSFPSGHTAVIFAVAIIAWQLYPKLRWLSGLICSVVICGLIGMNYHFVSDVVAGAFLGSLIATYTLSISMRNKP